MVNKENIFNNRTMNIVCDASIKNTSLIESTAFCAAKAVYGYCNDPITTDVMSRAYKIPDNDINTAELLAFELALDIAISHRSEFSAFNIYTDSNYVVTTLKKNIFRWAFLDDGTVTNPAGAEPKDLIDVVRIVKKIITNGVKVYLYHTVAHKKATSMEDMMHNKSRFFIFNNVKMDIDIEIIKQIAIMNNDVDNITKRLAKLSCIDCTDINKLRDKDIVIDNAELHVYKKYMN